MHWVTQNTTMSAFQDPSARRQQVTEAAQYPRHAPSAGQDMLDGVGVIQDEQDMSSNFHSEQKLNRR